MTNRDRMETLRQRLQQPSTSPVEELLSEEPSKKQRDRHSIYLSVDLMKRINVLYDELYHQLYPHKFTKSEFHEALIECGISDMTKLRQALLKK